LAEVLQHKLPPTSTTITTLVAAPQELKAKKNLPLSIKQHRAIFLELNCKEGKKM
jgi:hypothetical protein